MNVLGALADAGLRGAIIGRDLRQKLKKLKDNEMEIDMVNRSGEKIGCTTIEKARKILVKGQGTFHFEDGKYIMMVYVDERLTMDES